MLEFIDGNEAVVRGAIDAGCNFFAGYPITPASSICTRLSQELPKRGDICIQGEDEIASIGMCIAASVAGKKVMTASSGPGLSLYSENIGLAIMGEVPLVIVISQRQGPATGSATDGAEGDIQFARWSTSGGFPIVALMPTTVEECYTFTIECFNLAELLRGPVFLLINKELSMTREVVDWEKIQRPQVTERRYFTPQGNKIFLPHHFKELQDVPLFYPLGRDIRVRFTTSSHDPSGVLCRNPQIIDMMTRHFVEKILKNPQKITRVKKDSQDGADILVISMGFTARSCIEAVNMARQTGKKVAHLIIYTVWPVPEEEIKEASKEVKKVIVPEWNLGQYIYEVQRIVKDKKVVGINRMNIVPLSPEEILQVILNEGNP